MFEVLWNIVAFIVALGVLVSFHEFGHFWVARRLGVKVLRFSIGFGRAIWTRRGRDGVEYVIAAVPLGGYVKMLDEREGEVLPAEAPQSFNRQKPWKRIAIVAAGPAANLLMAFVAYWIVFVSGIPGQKPLIAEPPAASRAAVAGLHNGDEVIALDGEPVPTFQALRTELIERALSGDTVELTVRRDGATRGVSLALGEVRVDPEFLFDDLGLNPYQPPAPAVLGEIVKGGAAEAAGLRSGDRVLSINGTPITYYKEMFDWVRAHPGAAAKLEVLRAGKTVALTAIIRVESQDGETYGKLGAGVDVPPALWDNLVTEHRLSVGAAIPAAAVETVRMCRLTLNFLYRMVLGDVSVKNVSGPIHIAQVAGYTASKGLVWFVSFIAIMSVSLAVLNLLPVPVLDGGHLLYFLVETISGSPLSDRAQAIGQQVGLTMLMIFMVVVIYNDILKLIS